MDMRAKVAYEKAARLVDAEANKHEYTGLGTDWELCDYCEDRWSEKAGGCPQRCDLLDLAEQIRTLKRNA